MHLVSLKKEFASTKLTDINQDPDESLQELEYIRLRIKGIAVGSEIKDEDFVTHVLANLPDGYSEFISSVEGELYKEGSTINLNDLQVRLLGFYQQNSQRKTNNQMTWR